jgi:hypothetical protein
MPTSGEVPPSWPRRKGHHQVRAVSLLPAFAVHHDTVDRVPGGVRLEPLDPGVPEQRYVVVLERGPHAAHVGVGPAVGEAGKPVEAVAAHAASRFRVRFVEVHADRQVERPVAGALEIVVQLLDTRLVRYGRVREGPRARWLARVLAGLAVDEIEPLRLGVVGLEVLVSV